MQMVKPQGIGYQVVSAKKMAIALLHIVMTFVMTAVQEKLMGKDGLLCSARHIGKSHCAVLTFPSTVCTLI